MEYIFALILSAILTVVYLYFKKNKTILIKPKAVKKEELIDEDAKDARILSVKGTPTIFVNEKRLERLSQRDLFDLVESEIYK